MPETLIPGSIISLSGQAADRLLRMDSGDAALLYLQLLRTGSPTGLKWPQARLQDALTLLQKNGLAPQSATIPEPPPPPVKTLPDYSQDTINDALGDQTSPFGPLCNEVERLLGKRLTYTDMKDLYLLYDYMNLPPEVILMAVNWCKEQTERKDGPGRLPRMSYIRREASSWARLGVSTVEDADEHIRRMDQLQEREQKVLQLLDLPPRPLIAQEKKYIASWDEMGFDDEAIRMAYERTIFKVHELKWNYMNGILRNWHQKNLHTGAAILTGDTGGPWLKSSGEATSAGQSSSSRKPSGPDAPDEDALRDMAEIRAMLAKKKGMKSDGL